MEKASDTAKSVKENLSEVLTLPSISRREDEKSEEADDESSSRNESDSSEKNLKRKIKSSDTATESDVKKPKVHFADELQMSDSDDEEPTPLEETLQSKLSFMNLKKSELKKPHDEKDN